MAALDAQALAVEGCAMLLRDLGVAPPDSGEARAAAQSASVPFSLLRLALPYVLPIPAWLAAVPDGLDLSLGELCELRAANGALLQQAEVIGFTPDVALLSPFSQNISRSTQVVGLGSSRAVKVGDMLLGRVIDSLREPVDGGPLIESDTLRPIFAAPPDPMSAAAHRRARGRRDDDACPKASAWASSRPRASARVHMFGMFARGASCDVNVIALIGERGREVREFVELILGPEGMARSVVVCATSDRSSMERAKAAYVAAAIAVYFRDRGQRVPGARSVLLPAIACATRFSSVDFRGTAAFAGTRGHGREQLDFGALHGARRGRQRQRPDCRGSARHFGWSHDSLARDRSQEPLSVD